MPIETRSQAGARQSLAPVASPRNGLSNSPGKVSRSQQASRSKGTPRRKLKAGVRTRNKVNGGDLSTSMAEGSTTPALSRNCRSDCKTCPDLKINEPIKSSVTSRIYELINDTNKRITCKLQNYVYLLTCKSCFVQYVGESVIPLHLRMNIHRKGKSGCEVLINHFNHVCPNSSFFIQILEVLPGTGYLNGALDAEMTAYRKSREDFWMKRIRTIYPYGLCDKYKRNPKVPEDSPIGKLFPPLPRYGERLSGLETRTRNGSRNVDEHTNFFNIFETHFYDLFQSFEPHSRADSIRKHLDQLNKKEVKKIVSDIVEELPSCTDERLRWYEYTLDIINTKRFKEEKKKEKQAPKFIFPMTFRNKGLDAIKLGNIFRSEEVRSLLPTHLNDDENLPAVVYSLEGTIRNKIFNYKQTVADIDSEDLVTYGTGLASCDCADSEFCDPNHGHILTGDLRVIGNQKLRKLVARGPNFREAKTIHWGHCKNEITSGLEAYIDRVCVKFPDIETEHLVDWKNKVLEIVDLDIQKLKLKIKKQRTNPVLKQPEVMNYLNSFHEKFVMTPIDKASSNVAVICKRYYAEVVLKEIGILGNGSETYEKADRSKDEIIDDNRIYSEKLGYKLSEKEKDLPTMYWIPKMHKNPVKHRFIVASKSCSTKQLSKAVSNTFKLIHRQTENFHRFSKFDANYNKFWVIQNADPVLATLKKINDKKSAKRISCFDFSTLYTNIPHDKLLERLNGLVDFAFKGGNRNNICFNYNGTAYWGRKAKKKCFTKHSLKQALNHLISNCYFSVGNIVMRQKIGIPMGIDPAPFWANLFLYTYEHEYIKKLIKEDRVKAKHFHSTFRFIDDLCSLNDGGMFGRVFKDIYPDELELKVEHEGYSGTFLHLDIRVEENQFVHKLYDKRDAFPFSIVRMPYLSSNIPKKIFYSALVGEFLRIARATLYLSDFEPKAKDLVTRMLNQGGDRKCVERCLLKIVRRHPDSFSQFGVEPVTLVQTCVEQSVL